MIDILFIRHGATEGNLHRRYIGRTDEPLCAAGIAQAERLRGQNLSADCLFVSCHIGTDPSGVVEAEGVSFGLQFIEQQADAHVKGCLGGAVGAVSVSCPVEHGHASGF